jgi:hypothetical protein
MPFATYAWVVSRERNGVGYEVVYPSVNGLEAVLELTSW